MKEQNEKYNQLKQKCIELESTIKEKTSALEKMEVTSVTVKEDLSKQLQAATEASKNKQNKVDEVSENQFISCL